MSLAWAGLGSRLRRRQPSLSPSCVRSQKRSFAFTAVQARGDWPHLHVEVPRGVVAPRVDMSRRERTRIMMTRILLAFWSPGTLGGCVSIGSGCRAWRDHVEAVGAKLTKRGPLS